MEIQRKNSCEYLLDTAREIKRLDGEASKLFSAATEIAVKAGNLLLDVKSKLEHGEFGEWIENSLGWTLSRAGNYMRLASRALSSPSIKSLPLSVATEVAAPSVPEAAVAEVVLMASEEGGVTVAAARRVIRSHKSATAQRNPGTNPSEKPKDSPSEGQVGQPRKVEAEVSNPQISEDLKPRPASRAEKLGAEIETTLQSLRSHLVEPIQFSAILEAIAGLLEIVKAMRVAGETEILAGTTNGGSRAIDRYNNTYKKNISLLEGGMGETARLEFVRSLFKKYEGTHFKSGHPATNAKIDEFFEVAVGELSGSSEFGKWVFHGKAKKGIRVDDLKLSHSEVRDLFREAFSIPKPSGVDPRSSHPAILLFKGLTGKYPNKAIYDRIISSLGEIPDAEFAEAAYTEWISRGYRPENINWVEWVHDKRIPSYNGSKSIRPKVTPVPEERAAVERDLVALKIEYTKLVRTVGEQMSFDLKADEFQRMISDKEAEALAGPKAESIRKMKPEARRELALRQVLDELGETRIGSFEEWVNAKQ